MSELIAVGFRGKHRAAEVLEELQRLDEDWTIDLQDGVAAYRRDNGKLRVEQSLNFTGKQGAAWGGTFGLLIGAILAAPFTAGASAAAAAAAIGVSVKVAAHFARYGGTILRTTLNPLDKSLVQETIRA